MGFWKFCQDDEVAVSQQELNGLREGYAEHGEAWLRERLREQSFPQFPRLPRSSVLGSGFGKLHFGAGSFVLKLLGFEA